MLSPNPDTTAHTNTIVHSTTLGRMADCCFVGTSLGEYEDKKDENEEDKEWHTQCWNDRHDAGMTEIGHQEEPTPTQYVCTALDGKHKLTI